jgi:hypothetical protein
MTRVLYHPRHVQALRERLRGVLDEAKNDLHAMHEQHVAELADLRGELDELREILSLLVTLRREQAEDDIASLRAQLERALIRLAHRDGKPLH